MQQKGSKASQEFRNKQKVKKSTITYGQKVKQYQDEIIPIIKTFLKVLNTDYRLYKDYNDLYIEPKIKQFFRKINEVNGKWQNDPIFIKSQSMFGLGKNIAKYQERLTHLGFTKSRLESNLEKILSEFPKDLEIEYMLDEIEKEICNGVPNSKTGKMIKKYAREMALIILFEVQQEKGKITREYIENIINKQREHYDTITYPLCETMIVLRQIDKFQNPLKNEPLVKKIEGEICNGLTDTANGRVIKKRAGDLAIFIYNELQYEKAKGILEEKVAQKKQESLMQKRIMDENRIP